MTKGRKLERAIARFSMVTSGTHPPGITCQPPHSSIKQKPTLRVTLKLTLKKLEQNKLSFVLMGEPVPLKAR